MMKSFLIVFVAFLASSAAPAVAFAPSYTGSSVPKRTALSAIKDETETTQSAATRRTMLTTSLVATLTTLSSPSISSALETYLTEPTEEFKESEKQRMEFRKKQLAQKAEFVKVLARLTGESSTEEQLVNDLSELKGLVITTGGLPLGIKKEDMYKVIRSKKAKGFWPTNVEIA